MPDLKHGDLTLGSPDLEPGGAIPERFAASNDGASPELRWQHVPEAARELVLVMHDPDAPLVGGFTHWVAVGIDPSSDGLDGGASDGFVAGSNTMGDEAYMGPAPPEGHGPHHYFFHLYALDEQIDWSGPPDRAEVERRIDGHVVEQARLVGTFET
jgi:Raf kinase inhibitor-like YbhB/YbcL family protein